MARLGRLYAALALAAITPIWCVRYLPTVDGPSHLYNSWILQQLIRGSDGVVAQWYAIDWRPHPNWIAHVALALVMTIFPPLIAEKIVLSGIVLLFLYAMWAYAGAVDESRRPFAFLAFPFAYNLMLQMGFYSFCIGVALYFIVIAVWWRRRDRPDGRTIALVATLLLLCYFSNPLPAILALFSIALLWLVTLPGRNPLVQARHLLACVPVMPLLAWFARVQGTTLTPAHRGAAGLFSYLARMWVILTFDDYQGRLGVGLFVALSALIGITLARRRWSWNEGDGFILLTFMLIALYALAPAATSGGSMIPERMALFVVLSPLAWLAPRLPRRLEVACVIVLAATSLLYTGYLVRRYRGLSRRIDELVRSAEPLPRDVTLLPLIRDVKPPKGAFIPILAHAIDYAAVEKGDADIGNYEPAMGYFPIRFRPGISPPDVHAVGVLSLEVQSYAPRAPYLFAWHIARESPLRAQIDLLYDDIGGSDAGRLYRIKGAGLHPAEKR
jgi:hypothetical protein